MSLQCYFVSTTRGIVRGLHHLPNSSDRHLSTTALCGSQWCRSIRADSAARCITDDDLRDVADCTLARGAVLPEEITQFEANSES